MASGVNHNLDETATIIEAAKIWVHVVIAINCVLTISCTINYQYRHRLCAHSSFRHIGNIMRWNYQSQINYDKRKVNQRQYVWKKHHYEEMKLISGYLTMIKKTSVQMRIR